MGFVTQGVLGAIPHHLWLHFPSQWELQRSDTVVLPPVLEVLGLRAQVLFIGRFLRVYSGFLVFFPKDKEVSG